MPELPEVETVVRSLTPRLIGRKIVAVQLAWPRTFQGAFPVETCLQKTIHHVSRRGKYILFHLDDLYLTCHLRMTGRLYVKDHPDEKDRWIRLQFGLDQGQTLFFSDARKFGRLELVPNLDSLEAKLGPEPLEISQKEFFNRLSGSKQAMKSWLLNQKQVAGVGNIYADESLFRAAIHPLTPANRISPKQAEKLLNHLQSILKAAIQHEGSTISWYRTPDGKAGSHQNQFAVYGRAGLPCLGCGRDLAKIQVAQRTTVFCTKCQPEKMPSKKQ